MHMDWDAIYEHAGEATTKYLRNRTAAIYLEVSSKETYCGSAVCVDVNHRVFLLTAAHNFEGIKDSSRIIVFSANRSSDNPLNIIRYNYNLSGADGSNDVAWLEVDPKSAENSDLIGTDLNTIQLSPIPVDELCLFMGFPTGFARQQRDNSGHLNIIAPMMMYGTHLVRDDKSIVMGYAKTGFSPEQGIKEMPSPSGMSGGGIWLIPKKLEREDEIWDPSRLRLIGLTREYFRDRNEVEGNHVTDCLVLLSQDISELKESLGGFL